MSVHASAPGKLVLLGEYAVLEGAPALVMAGNRRAHVRLEPHAAGTLIDAPTLGITRAQWQPQARAHWAGVSAPEAHQLEMVHKVLQQTQHAGSWPALRARLDTDAFFSHTAGAKLGLGSSAALTVALHAALAAWTGRECADTRSLVHMHRAMQGGRGSGVDVACSVQGGALAYQWQDDEPQVTPLTLPPALHIRCVWSGQSASTSAFLRRIAAWRERAPQAYTQIMDELAQLAREGIDAVHAQHCQAFLEVATAYARTLETLGAASGADIVSAPHVKIGQIAASLGVVYKTCGAGGGDIGLALCDDAERMARCERALNQAGFAVLDIKQDGQGLHVEHDEHRGGDGRAIENSGVL